MAFIVLLVDLFVFFITQADQHHKGDGKEQPED